MEEKIAAFLKKNWIWSAMAFGIPFVVSVIICAAQGIYPFGQNCILHMDMYMKPSPWTEPIAIIPYTAIIVYMIYAALKAKKEE